MLEPALLKTLMEQISTLASVYHKPADTFVSRQRLAVQTVDTMASRNFDEDEGTAAAAAAAQVCVVYVGCAAAGWLLGEVASLPCGCLHAAPTASHAAVS